MYSICLISNTKTRGQGALSDFCRRQPRSVGAQQHCINTQDAGAGGQATVLLHSDMEAAREFYGANAQADRRQLCPLYGEATE